MASMISKIAADVADQWLSQKGRFEVDGSKFEELADAAQEAEFLHAENGRPYEVVALIDEAPFMKKGEVVYVSKGEV